MSTGVRRLRGRVLLGLFLIGPSIVGAQEHREVTSAVLRPNLIRVPVLDSVSDAPPPHAVWVQQKRWGLAIPGMLAGNVIPMVYNELAQRWKDISRTSPYTWKLYYRWWEWDDNHFFNNQFFHPFQGTFYYNGARANGFDYWWSVGFTAVGSLLWECCGERRPGAFNDLLNTTLGGAALGEMMFRTTSMYIDNEATGIDRIGLEALVWPLNGERGFARLVYTEYGVRPNPSGRFPDRWGLAISGGMRWLEDKTHPFAEFQVRYGDLAGKEIHAPFDYFVVDFQLNGQDAPIGRAQVSGHLKQGRLWGSPLEPGLEGTIGKWYLAQNYDYLDATPDYEAKLQPGAIPDQGYRYGGHSVSLGLAGAGYKDGLRVQGTLQAEGIPIGAVNSHYNLPAGTNISVTGDYAERRREYDFGVGGGGRTSWAMLWKGAKADVAYGVRFLRTVNGSNLCDSGFALEACDDSWHRIQMASAGLEIELDGILEFVTRVPVPWARHVWVGGDFFWFRKDSHYDLQPDQTHSARQWRVFLSWDLTRWSGTRVYGN